MIKVLRELKPLTSVPNRKHSNFPKILKHPLDELDVTLLQTWCKKHKTSLAGNRMAASENEAEREEDNDDNGSDEGTVKMSVIRVSFTKKVIFQLWCAWSGIPTNKI